MAEKQRTAQAKGQGLTAAAVTGVTAPAGTVLTVVRRTQRSYKPRARKCQGLGCEVVFTPHAKHGKYCSDVCRKRDHRWKLRRNTKQPKSEPVLELTICQHCGNSFLAEQGKRTLYCCSSHKSSAYRSRKKATIHAIMGDMNVREQEAAEGLELSGMKQARGYLIQQGYIYDVYTRAWVMSVYSEVSISA